MAVAVGAVVGAVVGPAVGVAVGVGVGVAAYPLGNGVGTGFPPPPAQAEIDETRAMAKIAAAKAPMNRVERMGILQTMVVPESVRVRSEVEYGGKPYARAACYNRCRGVHP